MVLASGSLETNAIATDPISSIALRIHSGPKRDRQKAILTLGSLEHPTACKLLLSLLHQIEEGSLPPFLWLEVLEAATLKPDPEIRAFLTAREKKNAGDLVKNYLECLEGGSALRGEEIFLNEAACFTCHSFAGQGGQVGPDLTGVGGTLERLYLLQSIVDPSAFIAPGFQNIVLELEDGSSISGLVRGEDPETLTLCIPPEGTLRNVPVAQIRSRTPLPSAMPPGLGEFLSRRKLRDLVEFLAAPTR